MRAPRTSGRPAELEARARGRGRYAYRWRAGPGAGWHEAFTCASLAELAERLLRAGTDLGRVRVTDTVYSGPLAGHPLLKEANGDG